MKRQLSIILSFLLIFTLSACSNSESQQTDKTNIPTKSIESSIDTNNSKPAVDKKEQSETETGNILIAYFTFPERDGIDAVASASRVVVDGKVVGNTQLIASWINQAVDGNLFAIETVETYQYML